MPLVLLDPDQDPVTRYLQSGPALGRHIEGLVDRLLSEQLAPAVLVAVV